FVLFFFQAEDGIRDFHVTGVQTCALPIYGATGQGDGPAAASMPTPPANLAAGQVKAGTSPTQLYYRIAAGIPGDQGQPAMPAFRSEERRVGKECRCRWVREP